MIFVGGEYSRMKQKLLIAVLLSLDIFWFSSVANAEDFEPVFAADQAVLTSRSQEFEVNQFRELARWRSVDDMVSSMEEHVRVASEEFERAKKLAESGAISKAELDSKKFEFDQVTSGLERVKLEQRQAEISTEISGLRVLEEGNPQVDFRLKIVSLRLEGVKLQKKSMNLNLNSSRRAEGYFEERYKNGIILVKKKIITKLEFEKRKSDYLDATNRVKVILHELESLELSIVGLEKSKDRIERKVDAT